MYTLREVKEKGLRHNSEANNKLMFFASKVSIYFSWIFVNIGLTANQVTLLFFLVGLLGAIIIFSYSIVLIIVSYVLFRLHIVFDVCDGEVARFNKQFSINGAYWDYMIHPVLYPLYYFGMTYATYSHYKDITLLYLGTAGVLVISLMLSVKNNYFRAKFFNNHSYDEWKKINTRVTDKKFRLFNAVSLFMSFEALFAFYIILYFYSSLDRYIFLFSIYIFFFTAITLVKFVKFSKDGHYTTRN